MPRAEYIARILQSYFICFLIYLPSAAQELTGNEIFTVKEGLSENVVHCLLQDKQGFLWIGTHEGLNRYDGYGFKKYLHDKEDSTSLPNSPVINLFEDGRGDLFVETLSGITKMDRKTGRFQALPISIPFFYEKNFRIFLPRTGLI